MGLRTRCAGCLTAIAIAAFSTGGGQAHGKPATTTTPIQHVVVIFQENVSFDHYFATYPFAANTAADALTAPRSCGTAATGAAQGRCGYGPRLPLLVVSPFAKRNFVDHTVTDQSSILRFIEDNWQLGRIGGGS
jgi:phospholipase C